MNAATPRNYAGGRPMLDADSHLMELPGFLDRLHAGRHGSTA